MIPEMICGAPLRAPSPRLTIGITIGAPPLNEIDPDTFDSSGMIHVEVEAGDAIIFGPFLVHRSAANTSDRDRRALLWNLSELGRTAPELADR